MQIHTEAWLVWNINTSVSVFAMEMVPPSTSCHSCLLSSCGQHRMESLGLNPSHHCAIKHHVWWRCISSGRDPKTDTAGECHLPRPPSGKLDADCSIRLFFYLPLFLFSFTYLFIICQKCQHLFGILTGGWYWILCFSSTSLIGHKVPCQSRPGVTASRMRFSVCKQLLQGAWHLVWRWSVEELTMLFRGNSSSCLSISSMVRDKRITVTFPSVVADWPLRRALVYETIQQKSTYSLSGRS